jgi:uncharacterized protein (TIGR03083 family)
VPTQLTVARHLEGLRDAMLAFVRYADRAGLSAPVPTCPDWTVRDLVAHQGMVHRWAAALVVGRHLDAEATKRFERQGRSHSDPLAWLREGAIELARAIHDAADGAGTAVFLNDAPGPRAFWARRQCHETTVHAVDALAAALGRPPRADEVWIHEDIATDGIDELMAGFLTRPISKLRCDEEGLLLVAPDDADDVWEVVLGPRPAVTTRRTSVEGWDPDPDWELTGTAVDLYLRLWNRTSAPQAAAGDTWRQLTAITWS